MIKRYLFAFGSLFAVTVLLVTTLTALAQMQQPGQQDQGAGQEGTLTPPGGTPVPGGVAGSEMMRGAVSGEVVNIDRRGGVIEILSDQGQPRTFKVAGDAKKQLSKIQKGDHVNLSLVLRAIDIRSTGKGGAQQGRSQEPLQSQPGPGDELRQEKQKPAMGRQ